MHSQTIINNFKKDLLEERELLNRKRMELSYELESYEHQVVEKLEINENLTDLMNEYKSAFEVT